MDTDEHRWGRLKAALFQGENQVIRQRPKPPEKWPSLRESQRNAED